MTRTRVLKNVYTITTYGYEGSDRCIVAFTEKLLNAIKNGYEWFVSGKYVYLIENEWYDSYIVTKYLKSDCTEFPVGYLIDDRARRYGGRLVARVEVEP